MSGGVGIVRTGAAARSGRRRRDCAGAGWQIPWRARRCGPAMVCATTFVAGQGVCRASSSRHLRTAGVLLSGGDL